VTFSNMVDRALNAHTVEVKRVVPDMSDFGKKFDPNHPAADEEGYVRTPNVNGLVEVMDLREARRSYEANLNVIEATRGMMNRTLDLLSR
jgi:flagellar basal-body rod protein FlgC